MRNSSDDILSLEPLLDRLDQIEDRINAVETRKPAEIARDVPAMLEAIIAPYMTAIRARLQAETQQWLEARLQAFEHDLEDKLSLRIATVEKAVIEQAGIMTTLTQKAIDSDVNLQRLISAMERLCQRAEFRGEAQPAPPAVQNQPFESHLKEAAQRPADGFRPKIVTEKEGERVRPRAPLARI
jgi:hypothetical protein